MKTPRIAICIGHSRFIGTRRDGGAVSVGGVAEWTYNWDLADLIRGHLLRYQIPSLIISEYPGRGYGSAIRNLANRLREENVTAAIELHFNSAGPTARGHEWLHWHSSKSGRNLAHLIDYEIRHQIPPDVLPVRGLKARRAGDRGAEFLRLTHCPAVICEPFFGSNADDWKIATTRKDQIALGIANGIDAWVDPDLA